MMYRFPETHKPVLIYEDGDHVAYEENAVLEMQMTLKRLPSQTERVLEWMAECLRLNGYRVEMFSS